MYSKRVEKILSFGVIKFNNKLFCILLIFALFFSFSSVCASDVNDNETVGISDYSINQSGASSVSSDRVVSNISNTSHVNGVLSVANSVSDDVLGASDETGSFSDFYKLYLLSSDTMTLCADYTYNSETDSNYENGITIDKTITIDGNGHTMDANQHKMFKIIEDNVILKKINMIDSYADSDDYTSIYPREVTFILENLAVDEGIHVDENSTFDMDNVTMTIADSNAYGIVYDAGASGTIRDSHFIDSNIIDKIINVNGDVNIKVFKNRKN